MGNHSKGRSKPKPKSKKAFKHSGWSSKRKLTRMGRKQKKDHAGLDATFIGRTACLKRLQISLKDFRRLCILKGIYPRELRNNKTPRKKKGQVYYHSTDVKALAHEPLLAKFREFKSFMKKIRKSAGRNEKDEAKRKYQTLMPSLSLNHLVRERYPRFDDALADLDDALALIHLFAALPSHGRIVTKVTLKAKELSAAWGAYCATTNAISKSFISIKGVYFEALVKNTTIRWIQPHAFTQNVPPDVDYRVMTTFFEFYEVLLSFVLFKLYNDVGIRYPFTSLESDDGESSTLLAAHLKVLRRGKDANSATEAIHEAVKESNKGKEGEAMKPKKTATDKKTKMLIDSVGTALEQVTNDSEDDDDDDAASTSSSVDLATPLQEALRSSLTENESTNLSHPSDDATQRRRLFSSLTFFLSREIPRGYLELLILSYGGSVGWDGPDSSISQSDPSITHHVVDRPSLLPSQETFSKKREFIQPQWIVDCANFMYLLPVKRYGVGRALPPHLSPFVNDEEEGYVPKYKEDVLRLMRGEVEVSEWDKEEEEEEVVDDKDTNDGNDDDDDKMEEETNNEPQEDDKDKETSSSSSENDDNEEDEDVEKTHAKKLQHQDDEAKDLAKLMMSRKAKHLYNRMQHGIAAKQSKVDALYEKRREIEQSKKKDKGKSVGKQKVERLKEKRRDIEDKYGKTEGVLGKKEGGGKKKKKRKMT